MYRVRAVSDGLIGANSGTIATTTYPDTPVVSEATDRNALKFRANWNAAEGAESYRVDLRGMLILNRLFQVMRIQTPVPPHTMALRVWKRIPAMSTECVLLLALVRAAALRWLR